jgi:hypothetical protein
VRWFTSVAVTALRRGQHLIERAQGREIADAAHAQIGPIGQMRDDVLQHAAQPDHILHWHRLLRRCGIRGRQVHLDGGLGGIGVGRSARQLQGQGITDELLAIARCQQQPVLIGTRVIETKPIVLPL